MTNGPMQGAATKPISSPMTRAPTTPPLPPEARCAQPGTRSSQSPNIEVARASRTTTMVPTTHGFWRAAPNSAPPSAASTPSTE